MRSVIINGENHSFNEEDANIIQKIAADRWLDFLRLGMNRTAEWSTGAYVVTCIEALAGIYIEPLEFSVILDGEYGYSGLNLGMPVYLCVDGMNTNQSFWEFCSGTLFGLIPYSFIYFCVLIVVYGFMLSNTKFGRKIYMVGGNRNAARLAGISVSRISSIMMVNCSVLAAFGGSILSGRMHSGNPASVHGTQLTAITAVVMGGVAFGGGSGNMLGAFLGIILLNVFNNALTVVEVSSFWQIIMSGVLLIVALMLDYFNSQRNEKMLKQLAASTVQ